MWLPKDERLLLVGYYNSIHAVGCEKVYGTEEFEKFLHCQRNSGNTIKDCARVADALVRSEMANKVLSERGLITYTPPAVTPYPDPSVRVSLTVEGYDLGRRYSHWFSRSGLWFNEYRNHWIWLLAAAIGGVVITNLVEGLWSFASNLATTLS